MPNIQEVEAGSGAIQVPERGSEAFAQEGRRVGSFYHQIGEDVGGTVKQLGDQYVEHQTNMEVSHLYAATTTAEQNLQTAWTAYTADPANRGRPDLASSFMEQHVKPVLDELASHAQTDTGKRLVAEEQARVSQNLFRTAVSDQSHLDGATWVNNSQQTQSNMAASVLADPSKADATIGDWMRVAENTIPSTVDPSERAGLMEHFQHEGAERIALAGYLGGIEAGKQQLAAGAATSPALDAVRAQITAGHNFQYLSPEQQATLATRVDEAEARGKEMHHQALAVDADALKRAGSAAYSTIDSAITSAITPPPGQTPRPLGPEVRQAIDDYARQYGASNPGEVHALNEAWTHATDKAQDHTLQRTDPSVWADINARMSLPPTDPHAVTDAELLNSWSAGRLSTEDLKLAREFKAKESDPAMKAAMSELKTWQTHMLGSLPSGTAGRGEAAGAFQHDSLQTFMQWIASGETPAQALEIMTNVNNPRNFTQRFDVYRRAAAFTDAASYLRAHDAYGRGPPAGTPGNPAWPTRADPGPQTGDGTPGNPATVQIARPAPATSSLTDAQVHDLMSH